MNPQPRGEVRPEHAARIRAALKDIEQSKAERDAAIVAALKAGGSVREVAKVAGMSASQIQIIGHAGGWPSVEQRAARAEQRRQNKAFEDSLRAAEVVANLIEESGPQAQA